MKIVEVIVKSKSGEHKIGHVASGNYNRRKRELFVRFSFGGWYRLRIRKGELVYLVYQNDDGKIVRKPCGSKIGKESEMFVVTQKAEGGTKKVYLVDRRKTTSCWWSPDRGLAMEFEKRSAAEFSAKKLKYGSPKVEEVV